MPLESVIGEPLLTTAEVAALTGRSESAIRNAISKGQLPADRVDGRRYLRRADVTAWHTATPLGARITRPAPWEHAEELLAAYHSLSAAELAEFTGVHIGNARKHLDQLRRRGRAERRADGQWVLLEQTEQGAA